MLSYLRIQGLALLEDVTIEFPAGLSILTGETGAGKSIIVDALALTRGARGRTELVRDGADAAVVEAQFELDQTTAQRVDLVLAAHGIPVVGCDGLVVQRAVSRAGRGRSSLQSTLTTQAVLSEVGEQLVDICSQHEHNSLTRVARHMDLLDAFGGLQADAEAYLAVYRRMCDASEALERLRDQIAEGTRRADYLRFQIEEIERVAPQPGEYEALSRRRRLLREAHRWLAFAREASEVLYEADDGIAGRLGSLLEQVRAGADGSESLAEVGEQLATAQIACEEAAREVGRFSRELDIEPGELERVDERVHQLESLRHKHGAEPDALSGHLADMKEELETLENAAERIDQAETRERELHQECVRRARTLRDGRRRVAKELGRAIEEELRALHIPEARLEVEVTAVEDERLGPRGIDRVQLVFSANAGEPPAALSRVASGGELSRVLLAIKGVLATGDPVATYVFDEVDAGVGGAVAESIGRRLHRASRERQVLCITHLPQIAAFADAHYRVDKLTRSGRTVVSVARLAEDERVEELARMLGGSRITASARDHAAQLLADAGHERVRKRGTWQSGRPSRARPR
jgi:DNA repair protein RecN (Recombination protein N)